MFAISKRPTISEIHTLYKEEKATSSEVVDFFLKRSKDLDKKLNSFYCYTEDLAKAQAQEVDKLLTQSKDIESLLQEFPLLGIPFSVKAIIQIEGEINNASSKILDNFKSAYSATVYDKITKAGGICIGINNQDEFACGASGETCAFGNTRNPYDTQRVPGGSSSGPAAAVGSGQVVFALGTDTGGSIRQPSAFCNVVGLKPTYGLVSRYGVMPMASSLDQVGGITNNVEDNLLVNKTLAGKDKNDQTTLKSADLIQNLEKLIHKKQTTRQSSKLTSTNKPLKIGLPKEFFIEGTDPLIANRIQELIKKLEQIGHTTVEVSIPLAKYALSVYYILMPVELTSNLERFDGVRYALQDNNDTEFELFYSQREHFGPEVKRRIMLGTYASSAGYYDAYYNQAQKVRYQVAQSFAKAFEECDVMIAPTSPEFPFEMGKKTDDALSMYLSDIFTCVINPVKIPSLNIPLGTLSSPKSDTPLPTGCQIMAPELKEDLIYTLALEAERLI